MLLQKLQQRVQQSLKTALDVNLRDNLVVNATHPRFGDYQCNIALPLAKELGKKPREVAEAIIRNLDVSDICEPLEIAGPGFINFRLKKDYVGEQLKNIYQDERLGIGTNPTPLKVIVDFSSPNIAKEMHVGHLRSTIIGDCIARILEFQGHYVLRINHVGDWGTQFGMLIAYLREAYPQALTTANALDLGDLVALYRKAKQRFDQDEAFQETARNEVVKLQAGAQDSRHAWQLLCEQSRREFQVIYDWLDINLKERGESFYNPFLPEIVEELITQGLAVQSEGALCVFLEGFVNKEGEPLPLIVRKSDGAYNYATTDLAALRYRIKEDGAQRIIYVTDAGQANHFAQVFQVATKAGLIGEGVEVVHVPFGLVLGEDGKKLKTRSGDTIKLKDLLVEAVASARKELETRLSNEHRNEPEEFIELVARTEGISAVKYADLSQNRNSNYVFSFEKMLSLQGNTAPYLLYAYVRIQGISRKGNIDWNNLVSSGVVRVEEEAEFNLAKHILQLGEVLQEVERDLLPSRLCQYLYELSQKFNQFYDSCPILSASDEVKLSRLTLADVTARALRLGLSLLGISVLERM